MSAFHNDTDPYCAQRLRNLIAAGHIAEGDVDDRDIRDLDADDVSRYRRCHFFAGIAGWDHALGIAGWPVSMNPYHQSSRDLSAIAARAGWATPRANKWGEPDSHGATAFGSPVPMEKRGALNPAHSRWLMGFQAAWDDCAPTAMPSSRRSRRSL